ncbi:MAG: GLUG motif-containing protein [Prevotella sp.]
MKRKLTQFRWLAATLMLVAAMMMPSRAWAQITPSKPSGDGSAASPYQIGSAAELYWFAALVNGDTNVDGVAAADKAACAELTTNITVNRGFLKSDGSLADDASGFTAWTPISTDTDNPYTGTFDGKDFTISGLYFNDTSKNLIGLFGFVGSGSKICNVGIVDSYFNGRSGIGGVCGYCISGEITNCYNTGTVIGTGSNIGGVCGYSSGTITDCYNKGNVSGTSTSDQEGRVGGVCGCNNGYPNMSTITRSYNSGKVSGGYNVGGVCGANGFGYDAQTINCYNTGEVIGTGEYVGGICGYNSTRCRIENCYNSAAVSGGSYLSRSRQVYRLLQRDTLL